MKQTMKLLGLGLISVALLGCANDKLQVITNGDRVASLEARAALNDELNQTQNLLLSVHGSALSSLEHRVSVLESRADALQAAIEEQVSINEDVAEHLADLQHELDVTQAVQALTNIVFAANLASLNSKVSVLQGKVTSLTSRMTSAEADIVSIKAEMLSVQGSLVSLAGRTSAVETGLASLVSRMSSAETSIGLINTDILYLKSKVVTIVDPCPSVANTEILLRVEGKLVAFYQGAEGFLSVLSNGSYRTTDPQQCTFSVSGDQIVGSTTPPPVTVLGTISASHSGNLASNQYQTDLTVTAGAAGLHNFKVSFALPAGQSMLSSYNCSYTVSGSTVTLTPNGGAWNMQAAPNATQTVCGFHVSTNAANWANRPTSYTVSQ